MIDGNYLAASDAIPHAQQFCSPSNELFFRSKLFPAKNGKPVLLNFGPQYLRRH